MEAKASLEEERLAQFRSHRVAARESVEARAVLVKAKADKATEGMVSVEQARRRFVTGVLAARGAFRGLGSKVAVLFPGVPGLGAAVDRETRAIIALMQEKEEGEHGQEERERKCPAELT